MDYFGFAFLILKIMNHNENKSLEDIVYFCEIDNKFKFEQWKDIVGYEGKYQVSDLGRVKSLSRNILRKNKYFSLSKELILKSNFNGNEYLHVILYKNGKQKTRTVHQLEAESFYGHIPCGYELVVDHKNRVRHDNRLINLRIITQLENSNKDHIPSTSKYRNVYFHRNTNKWRAQIMFNKKQIQLGSFDDEDEANIYHQNAVKAIKKGEEIVLKRKQTSSKYKGICWNKKYNKWLSRITINKKTIHIGNFETELEAHNAYCDFIKQQSH